MTETTDASLPGARRVVVFVALFVVGLIAALAVVSRSGSDPVERGPRIRYTPGDRIEPTPVSRSGEYVDERLFVRASVIARRGAASVLLGDEQQNEALLTLGAEAERGVRSLVVIDANGTEVIATNVTADQPFADTWRPRRVTIQFVGADAASVRVFHRSGTSTSEVLTDPVTGARFVVEVGTPEDELLGFQVLDAAGNTIRG